MKTAEPRWKIEARILMKTIKGVNEFEIEDAEGFCHALEERIRREQREECTKAYCANTSYLDYDASTNDAIRNAGKDRD